MKLLAFRIKNFRSIKDTYWQNFSLDNITGLIGQNEAGKTAILEALYSFPTAEISEDVLRSDRTMPEVSCSFQTNWDEIKELFKEKTLPKGLAKLINEKKRINLKRTWSAVDSEGELFLEEEDILALFKLPKDEHLEESTDEELSVEIFPNRPDLLSLQGFSRAILNFLNNVMGIEGYVFENYAPLGKYKRMYLSNENAKKIDSILKSISLWKQNNLISDIEQIILRTSLIEAIPFISNISGTYGAYLKSWDKRAFKSLTLEVPQFILSTNQHYCFQKDANELIRDIEADVLYLDPPYNNRQYISNYHVLETMAKNDKIELKGKTGLRKDDYLYKSKFSQKNFCVEALEDLIMNAKADYILMSYNSEGIIPETEIERIFRRREEIIQSLKKVIEDSKVIQI